MTTTYILKDSKSKNETLIFLVARIREKRIKISINEGILPDSWNKETCRARATKNFRGHLEFNTRLDKIEEAVKDKYRRFLNDHGRIPEMEELKALLLPEERKPVEVKKDFFAAIDDFIKEAGKRKNLKTDEDLAKGTITIFKTNRQMLKDFRAQYKSKINFDTIDLGFYHDYMSFLNQRKEAINQYHRQVH